MKLTQLGLSTLILCKSTLLLASGIVPGTLIYEDNNGKQYSGVSAARDICAYLTSEIRPHVIDAKPAGTSVWCKIGDGKGDDTEQHTGSISVKCPANSLQVEQAEQCQCDEGYKPSGKECSAGTSAWAGVEKQGEAINETRGDLVGKDEEHHVFPQKYKNYFQSKGINIDEYVVRIDREEHKVAHGKGNFFENWNSHWGKWIEQNPNASSQSVFEQAGKMMDEYGLSFSNVKNYKK